MTTAKRGLHMRCIAALALLAVSGCATTNAVNTSSGPPGSACIKGSIPSLGAFYGVGTQASIQIREIDGSPVKPEGWRSHCFLPGKHQIGFLADSANAYEGFRVADYVDLELAASGKYVLRGDFQGINLVLHILDVGASPETVMQELKFKISSHVNSPPITIPVPVTVHH
jgi:hypothetical protein